MSRHIDSILVLGLGKVGHLVALLLHETGFTVTGADLSPEIDAPYALEQINTEETKHLQQLLDTHHAVVSCLPYHLNARIARLAAENSTHYFDLTEDVGTTREIMELSRSHDIIMAPQCGLAPGFIGIVGAALAGNFEKIRNIRLRVGALPMHPTGLLGYAFNWSPEGVVNEYLNDCEVIEDGVRKMVSPLEWLETIVIDGVQLEAFTTSGGLGTMCDTYDGIVENLDYKSIRYPGHAKLMNFFLHELRMREDRKQAGQILVHAKPPVSEDVVFIHASVEGRISGHLSREEFVRSYRPIEIAGATRRTIAWTTACSVCSIVELAAERKLPEKGFIRQEDIPLNDFLTTANGTFYNTDSGS